MYIYNERLWLRGWVKLTLKIPETTSLSEPFVSIDTRIAQISMATMEHFILVGLEKLLSLINSVVCRMPRRYSAFFFWGGGGSRAIYGMMILV